MSEALLAKKRSVYVEIELENGLVGLVYELKKKDIDEVLDIMADVVSEEYGFAPTEIMESLNLTDCSLDLPDPVGHRYDYIIPLRQPKDRRNCACWNSSKHHWDIRPFNPKTLTVTGETVMIIALKR
jgi:hypothetical protein